MSIGTWKKEFYPTTAAEACDESKAAGSDIPAILNSIRKWEGLRPKNLARHCLSKDGGNNRLLSLGQQSFVVNDDTCALCHAHTPGQHGQPPRVARPQCHEPPRCPVVLLANDCDDYSSPYLHWCDTGSPMRMLKVLKEAARMAARASKAAKAARKASKPRDGRRDAQKGKEAHGGAREEREAREAREARNEGGTP